MDSIVPGPVEGDPPVDASTTIHSLVYNAPANPSGVYGPGWTLVASRETGWRWSVELAEQGAGAYADTRAAKAVAARVLGDRGIRVAGWSDGFVAAPPMHRAVLDTRLDQRPENDPSSHPPIPAPRSRSSRLGLQRPGSRRGLAPGH